MYTLKHTTIPFLPYVVNHRCYGKVSSLHQPTSASIAKAKSLEYPPECKHLRLHVKPPYDPPP